MRERLQSWIETMEGRMKEVPQRELSEEEMTQVPGRNEWICSAYQSP